MTQRARDGGAAYVQDVRYDAKSQGWRCVYLQDVRADICSSVTASCVTLIPYVLYIYIVLLPAIPGSMRCSNMLHQCNDAISALPTSVVGVCRKESRDIDSMFCIRACRDNLKSVVVVAIFYLAPSFQNSHAPSHG